jgi:hypothetical protein
MEKYLIVIVMIVPKIFALDAKKKSIKITI